MLDQPIILTDFSMFGPGAPLCYKGRPLNLTGAEACVVWTLMKACPDPVQLDVILDRLDSDASLEVVSVFVCRIRKKFKAAGAPNMIRSDRRHNKRAYRWMVRGDGLDAKIVLPPEAAVPVRFEN